jgi:hypothetical protein
MGTNEKQDLPSAGENKQEEDNKDEDSFLGFGNGTAREKAASLRLGKSFFTKLVITFEPVLAG